MSNDQIIIDQLLGQFDSAIAKAITLFDTIAVSDIDTPVAPGRNPVHYIIGHLIMASDQMLEALELGERFYPELDGLFAKPYNVGVGYPQYVELRKKWIDLNNWLCEQLHAMSVTDWLSRHHYVNPEDFTKEPNRNKLAILITRYAHLQTHIGQLRLIQLNN